MRYWPWYLYPVVRDHQSRRKAARIKDCGVHGRSGYSFLSRRFEYLEKSHSPLSPGTSDTWLARFGGLLGLSDFGRCESSGRRLGLRFEVSSLAYNDLARQSRLCDQAVAFYTTFTVLKYLWYNTTRAGSSNEDSELFPKASLFRLSGWKLLTSSDPGASSDMSWADFAVGLMLATATCSTIFLNWFFSTMLPLQWKSIEHEYFWEWIVSQYANELFWRHPGCL